MLNERFIPIPLVFMVTIVNRSHGEKAAQLFTNEGVTYNVLTLGMGTAKTKLLDYLGLGETEKDVLFSTMPYAISRILLKKLQEETNLDLPGHGIAFTLPIGSVCGVRAAGCLQGGMPTEREESEVEQAYQHDLIIAIANRGFTDDIMEAAESAKATGGTALHARRVGVKEAEKFFGVTIHPEKEIILILTKSEYKQGIMQAITTRSGLHTEAKAITFSLPVNGVAGLPNLDPKPE